MTLLLFGENEVAINRRKAEIKAEFKAEQIWEFAGKSVTPEDVAQALGGQSLFGTEPKLVIIDGPLGNKALLESLFVPAAETTLLILENKKLTATQIASLKSVLSDLSLVEYKLDSAIFKFVDSLAPGSREAVSILKNELADEVPEVIFVMLVRQFRYLLLAKERVSSGPEDYQRLAPWQKQKLQSQAMHFKLEVLKDLYQKLLLIDLQTKSGQFPGTLKDALETFLLLLQ